ncbi:hypothetical protein AB3S75_022980 [Citrus x aurantiifolia]
MDTEELIRKCRAITIREEDRTQMSVEVNMKARNREVLAGCLVGKVLLSKSVNKEGLKSALQQTWRTLKEVKIESLGSNIFMFKFAAEADKRRVIMGGPWHFDRALIVLTKPRGIGEISKQSFDYVSFWVQIRNVPIACMEKGFLHELGGKIGEVEEVEANENGDCIGELARIRITINITQPLKKVLFLKQEGEPDIPMPVVYERLPDFCFCCGIIGHQYKECSKYQGQPKEDFPFEMWMKAITIGGRLKKYCNKERWQNEGDRAAKSTSSEHQEQSQQNQQEQMNPNDKNGLEPDIEEIGQTRVHDSNIEVQWVVEKHLMEGGTELMVKKQVDGKMVRAVTGNVTAPRELRIQAGDEVSKVGENSKTVRDEMPKEIMGPTAILNSPTRLNHEEMEEGRIRDGLGVSPSPANRKKWKRQARALKNEGGMKLGLSGQKGPNNEAIGPSPKQKKCRGASPSPAETKKYATAAAVTTQHWEPLEMEEMDLTAAFTEEISAEAGSQPRRKP